MFCDSMQNPENGFIEGDMYGIVKTIKFTCFPGYSLKGSEKHKDGTRMHEGWQLD